MTHSVPLWLIGGGGRMGRAIRDLLPEFPDFKLSGVVDAQDPGVLPEDAVWSPEPTVIQEGPPGVVVDFSSPRGWKPRIAACAAAGHALVECTTGYEAAALEFMVNAAEAIPIVVAPNTSPGVAVLKRALSAVAATEGMGWDVGIVDRHHRHKQDAPSGTARSLEETLRAHGLDPSIVSLRQGGVVGEHTVTFSAEDEEIVFQHRAFDRRVFARGALLAARFVSGRPPRLYSMDDVLGLDTP